MRAAWLLATLLCAGAGLGCRGPNAPLPGVTLPGPEDPVAKAGPPRLVAEGFTYLEGPVWLPERQELWFVDPKLDKLFKVTPAGTSAVVRDPNGGASGLGRLPNGDVVLLESAAHRLVRLPAGGAWTVFAHEAEGQPLDRPNDVTVRSDGMVYVTLPFVRQVLRLSATGEARRVWQGEEGTKPNGIGLSPDERILYVTDTLENLVRAFPVHPDGSLGAPTVFAAGLGLDRHSTWVTDGMAVDRAGNVYVASYARPASDSPGEIAVFRPNGARWGRLLIPRGPSNVTFGGADGKTLYVTAQGALYALAMPIAGVGDFGRPRAPQPAEE